MPQGRQLSLEVHKVLSSAPNCNLVVQMHQQGCCLVKANSANRRLDSLKIHYRSGMALLHEHRMSHETIFDVAARLVRDWVVYLALD